MKSWVARAIAGVLGLTGVVVLSGGAATPAAAATVVTGGPSVGTVVFDQPIAGQEPGLGSRRDIVLFKDGVLTNLTKNVRDPETDFLPSSYGPSLSADGARILYTHCEYSTFIGGSRQADGVARGFDVNEVCSAWVMNVNGTGKHRVEDPHGIAIRGSGWWGTDFDWGPGGEAVFTEEGVVKAFDPDIGVVRTVSSSATWWWDMARWLGPDQLVVSGSLRDADGDQDYSADGEVFSMTAEGTALVNLTKRPDWDDYFAVGSPGGNSIAYLAHDEWGNYLLTAMDADGSAKRRIYTGTTFNADEYVVGWSYDEDAYGLLVGDTDGAMSFAVQPVVASLDQLAGEPQRVLDFVDEPGIDWLGDVDLAPVAETQNITVPKDTAVEIELVGYDPDGTPVTYTVTQPAHGTVTGTAPNLTYTPGAGYVGADSFTFKVTSHGLTSRSAKIAITVSDEDSVADLAVTLRGVGDKTRVGKIDLAKATVTNKGPRAAAGVVLKLGVPKGLAYGYVKKPSLAWTCSIKDKRFIRCTVPSMQSGASATLRAGLFAKASLADRVRVVAKATSDTRDVNTANNQRVALQKIKNLSRPAPPSARELADARQVGPHHLSKVLSGERRDYKWFQVSSKYNLWIKTTNVYVKFPDPTIGEMQGAAAATMYGWSGPGSRVVRFEFKHIFDQANGGLGWANLSQTGKKQVADDGRSHWSYFSHQFPVESDWYDGKQVGKWTFVRSGLSRNVKYKVELR